MAEFNENSLEIYGSFFDAKWHVSCFLNSELKLINQQLLIINKIPFHYHTLKRFFESQSTENYIFGMLGIYKSPSHLLPAKINELRMIIIDFLVNMEELFDNDNIKEFFKGIKL